MANGTPPKPAAKEDKGKATVANGNGNAAVKDAAWKIVTVLTLAGVMFVAGLLWDVNAKLAVIEATMVTDHELAMTLQENVPPEWFRNQVNRIETNLEAHARQTANQAHRGGG